MSEPDLTESQKRQLEEVKPLFKTAALNTLDATPLCEHKIVLKEECKSNKPIRLYPYPIAPKPTPPAESPIADTGTTTEARLPSTYQPATAVAKWSLITTDTLPVLPEGSFPIATEPPGRITSDPRDQVGHRQQGGYSSRHLKPVTPPCSPPPPRAERPHSPRARRQSTCRIKLRNILRPATCPAVSTTTSRQNQVSGPSPANYEPGGHNYEPSPVASFADLSGGHPTVRRPNQAPSSYSPARHVPEGHPDGPSPESSPAVVSSPPRARRPPRLSVVRHQCRSLLWPATCSAATPTIH
nr:proline-rich receptor-like protein kinase PERK9 [Aedes albopictus]